MQANRSIPAATVLPELAYPDVNAAADWLCRAFGFAVRLRIADHRVQMSVPGGGALVVKQGEVAPDSCSSHSVMVRVADVDAHHARAAAAGAAAAGAPTTYPFGERQYGVRDFAGHHWVFTQSVADVDPASWGGELHAESATPPHGLEDS
ncbi:VOC family protein [Pelomonas sp. Root1237]|uniref:VOC family protein n=1 Tax=Pelomonas sp. Root1237 TaxID=1736434 RepID=UPI0006FFCDFE|nr:VOC family protein [Pelomonas sp. Root1237]KQV96133.1 glyoxalase [Pelomonas sp. Root1237]